MKTDAFCLEQNRVEFNRGETNVTPLFELALHTDKPEGSDQSSKEVDLDGYERLPVMRSEAMWSVRGRTVTNASLFRFSTIKRGEKKATWLSIGIGGRIRRLVKLKEPVELKANRRVEFDPGEIEVMELG